MDRIGILFELIVDAGASQARRLSRAQREYSPLTMLFVYGSLGGLLGWASTRIIDHLLLPHAIWRALNLVITPLIVAAVMAWIGRARTQRGLRTVRLEVFVYAWLFALAFAVTRWIAS